MKVEHNISIVFDSGAVMELSQHMEVFLRDVLRGATTGLFGAMVEFLRKEYGIDREDAAQLVNYLQGR